MSADILPFRPATGESQEEQYARPAPSVAAFPDERAVARRLWAAAGLDIVAAFGVGAVAVRDVEDRVVSAPLRFEACFDDWRDFLSALRAVWEADHALALFARIDRLGGDADLKLSVVFELAAGVDVRLERAMRRWAEADDEVAASVGRVDRRRLSRLAAWFAAVGFNVDEARQRAQLAYAAWLGGIALSDVEPRWARRRAARRLLCLLISRAD